MLSGHISASTGDRGTAAQRELRPCPRSPACAAMTVSPNWTQAGPLLQAAPAAFGQHLHTMGSVNASAWEELEEGALLGEGGDHGVCWGRMGTLCCPQAGEGSSAVLGWVRGAEHPGGRTGMVCFPGKERQGCSASQGRTRMLSFPGQGDDAEHPRGRMGMLVFPGKDKGMLSPAPCPAAGRLGAQ